MRKLEMSSRKYAQFADVVAQALGEDPLNWDNYTAAPQDLEVVKSCQRSHQLQVEGIWNKAAVKSAAEKGGTELKFSAKACPGMHFPENENKDDVDYLTKVMAAQLKDQGACFDFMLQEKVASADMPIDDATVIWSEKASPFVPVARINIPPQNFTSEKQMAFCENLSMNPWHGVGQWQPLGSLNRARRLV